jgi:outer membrane protein
MTMNRRASATLWTIGALLLVAWGPTGLHGQEVWQQQDWGLGFTMRTANIPFATDEKTVATLIPLIMFENRWVYLRETELGFKFVDNDRWRLSAMGRLHFFDIPVEFQNEIQGDRVDWGVQLRYKPWTGGMLDLELLTDRDGHASQHLRIGQRLTGGRFRADVFGDAAYKTRHYNTTFWGLERDRVEGGVDWTVGGNAYFHLISSLYLQGAVAATYLSGPVRDAPLVEDDVHLRGFLGVGFSNDRLRNDERELTNRGYWRVAQTWGTPSRLSEHPFKTEPDSMNSKLTTVFYGLPLTDRLFGLPIDIYLHTGAGLHWSSDYQDPSVEVVASIKLLYTIPLPWRIRVGFAEGVSYVNRVPALEAENLAQKDYKPSEYLNYLDPSVEISLGDIIPWDPLENLWLGYAIHHRSAIFKTAQQFGRIKGGSNYPGVTLTWHR